LSVTAALQKYAARGVLRGLSTRQRADGRYEHTFRWLMQRSFTLTHDPTTRELSFRKLFTHVSPRSAVAAALGHVVAERTTRRVPAHKRLDRRKAEALCAVNRGQFSLTMRVRGAHDAYAVQKLLAIVNDLYLELQERFPDYLIEQFGLSAE
jgi:hypothetical protein